MPEYDLTILALMRDSMGYFSRFIEQVNGVFSRSKHNHLIITEGDSVDGTKDRLADLASNGNLLVNADVTVVVLDTGTQAMGSSNHPTRWRNLELAWNTNLSQLEPTRYAICVESDLIWSLQVAGQMIDFLDDNVGDVMCPKLMCSTPQQGHYWYDTNAFRLNGKNFQNFKPYHPDWNNDERFMKLDTGGGMLVTYGKHLERATWKNQCVLHFPEELRVICDTQSEILHP